jgi:hypothetical protein
MKKTDVIFLLLWGFPAFLPAQHSLQSRLNMFRPEDAIVKQQVEYKEPGRTGANVLWDFSRLNVVNDEYELIYSAYNDTVITGTEHLTNYHYALQNDSLLLWGFENQTTKLRNVQPELLLKFPFHYGDTTSSYYYAHGKYGNRLELDAMGSLETVADSYGMMILPSKDTLKHVLRTHTLKYIAEDTRPIDDNYYEKMEHPLNLSSDSIRYRIQNDSAVFVVETFRWYEEGYRYPVFETVRSWEQYSDTADYEFLATAFFYPPQEHYYRAEDADNLSLLASESDSVADPWAGLSYNLYPNPVKNVNLNVEIYLPKSAQRVLVQLRSTMGLIISDQNLGAYSEGMLNFQVDTWHLPVGNYILDIWLDEKLISEIIMKR